MTYIVFSQQRKGAEDLVVFNLEGPRSLKVAAEVCYGDGLDNLLCPHGLDLPVGAPGAAMVLMWVAVDVRDVVVASMVEVGHGAR